MVMLFCLSRFLHKKVADMAPFHPPGTPAMVNALVH